ncbi:MAG: thioredoxin [Clostridia bacterium]|nr:thioredoxin [Clostridia bacterium]
MIHFTKDNFEDEVIRSDRPVVIDFWAEWCGPCRMFAPTFEAVAEEMPDIKFGKVNVDEQPELAQQFRVMSIPTIILMKEGRIVNKTMGAMSPDMLKEFLNS